MTTAAASFQATVVVAVRDDERGIAACVDSLRAQTIPLHVIVVDDGSTDRTGDVAAEHGATVIRAEGSGAAAARNLGVSSSTTDVVLFTDGDCVPTERWAESLLAALERGVIAAKGTYLTEQRSSTARFVQLEYEERFERMRRCMERRGEIDFLDTYSLAVDRRAFLSIRGFDESFAGASVEDQEMSFRLAQAGRFAFVPRASVFHRHADTPGAYVRKKFKIGRGKASIVRRYRDRLASDSHTPATLRWQVPSVAFTVLAAVSAIAVGSTGVWVAAASATAPWFLSSNLLASAVRRHGWLFGFTALGLVQGRAWALTLGFLLGFVTPMVQLGDEVVSSIPAVDPEVESTERQEVAGVS